MRPPILGDHKDEPKKGKLGGSKLQHIKVGGRNTIKVIYVPKAM